MISLASKWWCCFSDPDCETVPHLFWQSDLGASPWSHYGAIFGMNYDAMYSWQDFIIKWCNYYVGVDLVDIIALSFGKSGYVETPLNPMKRELVLTKLIYNVDHFIFGMNHLIKPGKSLK